MKRNSHGEMTNQSANQLFKEANTNEVILVEGEGTPHAL